MRKEIEEQKLKKTLLELADEMAEYATDFRGQGYRLFLDARERLKEVLEQEIK
jgi:hypothetical protein